MDLERWEDIKALFHEAADREPLARERILAEKCAGDTALRAAVVALLNADEEAGGFLETEYASEDEDVPPATEVGPYRILEKIGEGGMSTVYLAERDDGTYRVRVAVKFLRVAIGASRVIKRFRVEQQILANLDHPYVQKLIDAGSTATGVPYIVMEYVEGTSIDRYCERERLSVTDRLTLILKVCAAVQSAHGALVVHRDIKPSNILVRQDGEPRLLDFGIAKLLDPASSPVTVEPTRADALLMTPEYASPEQARGEPVTTATDVYSLGVLLYKLLTGLHPYGVEGRPVAEILRILAAAEPVPPSARISSPRDAAAHTVFLSTMGTSAAQLKRRLAGDLDAILLKAIRKDPRERYASVEQFAEEIRRHLAGAPVAARKGTLRYRASKFAGRNRYRLAVAAVLLAAGLGFTVTTVVQARRLSRALAQSEAVTSLYKDALGSANPFGGVGREVTVAQVLDRAADRTQKSFADRPDIKATLLATIGTTYRDLGRYREAEPLLEQALALRRETFGNAHKDVAESLMALGALYVQTVDPSRSEALYRKALDITTALYGRDSLETATALHELGNALSTKAAYAEAEPFLRDSLAIRRRHLPGAERDVAATLTKLGTLLRKKGDFANAEPLLREALEVLGPLDSDVSPDAVNVKQELAKLFSDRGDFASAEPLLKETAAAKRKLLGNDHTAVADALTVLGGVLFDSGAVKEAIPYQVEALSIYERVLGPENVLVARASVNLANSLSTEGSLDQAETLMRRAVRIMRTVWGERHADVALALINLGSLLDDQNKLVESRDCLREAFEMNRSLLGATHPYTLAAQTAFAKELFKTGEPQRALAVLQETKRLYAAIQEPNAYLLAHFQLYYGDCLAKLKRYDDARNEIVPAYVSLASLVRPDHNSMREARELLVELRDAWRNPEFSAEVDRLLSK